jgi:hypothetical protein
VPIPRSLSKQYVASENEATQAAGESLDFQRNGCERPTCDSLRERTESCRRRRSLVYAESKEGNSQVEPSKWAR